VAFLRQLSKIGMDCAQLAEAIAITSVALTYSLMDAITARTFYFLRRLYHIRSFTWNLHIPWCGNLDNDL